MEALPAPSPCPRCAHPLEAIRRGPLTLDVCRACGGGWFDKGELQQVHRRHPRALSLLEQALAPSAPSPGIPAPPACPRCRVPLAPFTFAHAPGVRLLSCPACGGTWADHGTLAQLEAAVRSRPAGPDPAGSAPCPHCGAPLLPADARCLDCGHAVEAGRPAPALHASAPTGPRVTTSAPLGRAHSRSGGEDMPSGLMEELEGIKHRYDPPPHPEIHWGRRGSPLGMALTGICLLFLYWRLAPAFASLPAHPGRLDPSFVPAGFLWGGIGFIVGGVLWHLMERWGE